MGVYESVIVGTDGSATAQRAVRRAAVIASGLGCPLLVATCYQRTRPEDLGPRSARAGLDLESSFGFSFIAAQQTAQDGATEARRVAPGLEVDTSTPQGEPADALIEVAERHPKGLLVVGGQGLGASALFMLGNVPNKVVHHPAGDILVVRTNETPDDDVPRTVLVGTDGSETATKALDKSVAIAKTLNSSVTVLTVGRSDWANDVLAEAEDRVKAAGVPVVTQHADGDPAAVLVDRSKGFGMVVLGNRGMTGARRFFLGSVPNKVTQHVGADLLIVKTT